MTAPRFFVGVPLASGSEIALPPGAARHAQVRRVQPGDTLLLFDGSGADFAAEVLAMGRSSVQVRVGAAHAVASELPFDVTLALAVPANERMDALVEKATELGAARIQPLEGARSVLRLAGERAERRRAHWQAVAVAACEQCGRARVPVVEPLRPLADWLPDAPAGRRLVLSLAPEAQPAATAIDAAPQAVVSLSGPEGGLADAELAAARRAGFQPVTLGPRVLRADTAPLALLAWLALRHAR